MTTYYIYFTLKNRLTDITTNKSTIDNNNNNKVD